MPKYEVTIRFGKKKRTKVAKSKVRARRWVHEAKAAGRFFGLKPTISFRKVKRK